MKLLILLLLLLQIASLSCFVSLSFLGNESLQHKITNELAFEIDNKIMRCTQIITNEGTLESIKRGKK